MPIVVCYIDVGDVWRAKQLVQMLTEQAMRGWQGRQAWVRQIFDSMARHTSVDVDGTLRRLVVEVAWVATHCRNDESRLQAGDLPDELQELSRDSEHLRGVLKGLHAHGAQGAATELDEFGARFADSRDRLKVFLADRSWLDKTLDNALELVRRAEARQRSRDIPGMSELLLGAMDEAEEDDC